MNGLSLHGDSKAEGQSGEFCARVNIVPAVVLSENVAVARGLGQGSSL
eukprot:CAMPEP_0197630290 /NCGR_PEP_ID=MMETSP1338-20131121/7828_1 /TAXON_ID=43686 ORGANISM="Pelagodinium beii, Strain RCC1491" /NCGR_SAMPLE_ID=MMETSP1338 /ASSEMBLY_ACC=CAM_ASM_000754 /LENGTH=47 /DNA_ID= /DNA_START= /DNA_END= /DNA_ORIENTATION=